MDETPNVPVGAGPGPAQSPEPGEPDALKAHVIDALKTVYDPEIPVNVYDMGLIYGVEISADGHVDIRMTLTTPNCPVAEWLPMEVEMRARGVDGVIDVALELVWDPPWTPELLSEAARLELGMM